MENNLTDENFDKEINSTDKFVLVDFFAVWCEPCQILGPIIEKVADQFKDRVILMKANLDANPLAAQKFGVEKIPTVVLFKSGEPINGFVGLVPEKAIKEWLENLLKKHGKSK